MKHWLAIFLTLISLSTAGAQQTSFGVGAAFAPTAAMGEMPFLALSLQLATETLEPIRLRLALDTFLLISDISISAHYRFPIYPAVSGYAGAGLDVIYLLSPIVVGIPAVGVHALLGLEQPSGSVRLYGEVLPYMLVQTAQVSSTPTPFGVRARAGVNFYF